MNIEYAKETFKDIASQYDDYDEIDNRLFSLVNCKELSQAEYDYIQSNWDNLLIEFNL